MHKLLAGIALVSLLALGVCGWLAVDRQVRVVKVEGQLSEAEAAQIRRRIGQVLQRRLLTMDVARLRERVLELSWPGAVSVRKVWPDTIVVRVARRSVVARWADAGYLTPAGEILNTPNGPLDLPVFDCALSSPRQAMELYRYLQGMARDAGLVIDQVVENELGEWRLAVSAPATTPAETQNAPGAGKGAGDIASWASDPGSLTVMLGADRLRERMQRFLVACSRLLGSRAGAVEYVDLRYQNGIAVRWREGGVRHAGAMTTLEAEGTT